MNDKQKVFIKILLCWLLLSTTVVTVFTVGDPIARVVVGMGWGLIILWIFAGGYLMYRFRDRIREIVQKIPLRWQLKFVLFATFLALVEEAITTAMTNSAPLFGLNVGQAYITASANFFDVVFFHSVINFIGPFIFWALALKRYDFSPFETFTIFGISGVFAEVGFGGPQHFAEFALWIFVYGLMIFLPTYCLPPAAERGAKPPRFYMYPLMVFLPSLFVPLVAWIPRVVDPSHPKIDFPPSSL